MDAVEASYFRIKSLPPPIDQGPRVRRQATRAATSDRGRVKEELVRLSPEQRKRLAELAKEYGV